MFIYLYYKEMAGRLPQSNIIPRPAVNVQFPLTTTRVNVPLPTFNVPLPTVNVPLPTFNVPLPTVNVPLPTVNVPLRTVNVPLPTVNVPLPTVNVPLPTVQVNTGGTQQLTTRAPIIQNNYQQQDEPEPDNFKFTASAVNTDFIQASIQTARDVFPSLEVHIQVAEEVGILEEDRRRSNFLSYMRDASPFEIYKIYQGEEIFLAKTFLTKFMETANIVLIPLTDEGEELQRLRRGERIVNNAPWINFGFQERERMEQLQPIVDEEMRQRELIRTNYSQRIIDAMQRRGYIYNYIGFIRTNHSASISRSPDFPLTPESFVASITPDQAILMEAWRKEALTGGLTNLSNLDILDLRSILDQYRPEADVVGRMIHAPVLQTIGFRFSKLKAAIDYVADRLQPGRQQVTPKPLPITRDYIMYEGEKAQYICGRKTTDIRNKGLVLNDRMPKAYYMMLYNELRLRRLLNNTTF